MCSKPKRPVVTPICSDIPVTVECGSSRNSLSSELRTSFKLKVDCNRPGSRAGNSLGFQHNNPHATARANRKASHLPRGHRQRCSRWFFDFGHWYSCNLSEGSQVVTAGTCRMAIHDLGSRPRYPLVASEEHRNASGLKCPWKKPKFFSDDAFVLASAKVAVAWPVYATLARVRALQPPSRRWGFRPFASNVLWFRNHTPGNRVTSFLPSQGYQFLGHKCTTPLGSAIKSGGQPPSRSRLRDAHRIRVPDVWSGIKNGRQLLVVTQAWERSRICEVPLALALFSSVIHRRSLLISTTSSSDFPPKLKLQKLFFAGRQRDGNREKYPSSDRSTERNVFPSFSSNKGFVSRLQSFRIRQSSASFICAISARVLHRMSSPLAIVAAVALFGRHAIWREVSGRLGFVSGAGRAGGVGWHFVYSCL